MFFSPVSIGKGNVAGEKYEPKIFNALTQSKAMILIGSNAKYITNNWVRDEWSRYLYFMHLNNISSTSPLKKGANTLFYVYRENIPRNLPSQIAEIEGIDCSSVNYLDELYKAIRTKIGNPNNGIERVDIVQGERLKKDKVEIETIKTITLDKNVVAKKQNIIAGNLQAKDFGTNKVDDYDADTKKILDGAFVALEDGNFAIAKHEFDEILSNGDNATALYGKILLTLPAKNAEEFAKNAEQFPKGELNLYHKLMSCATNEEAIKATDLILMACKQCCADLETKEAIMFFNTIMEYKIPQRNQAYQILKEAIPNLIKAHDVNITDVIDSYLGSIPSDKVDIYIKECLSIISNAINTSSFSIAEKYNDKVLELYENSHDALFNKLYIKTNTRNLEELAKKISKVEIRDIEFLVNNTSAELAKKDIEYFTISLVNEMEDSFNLNDVFTMLSTLLKYNFNKRGEIIDKLSKIIIDKKEKMSEADFNKYVDYVLSNFNTSNVDKHICYMLKVADTSLRDKQFDTALKYFNKVLNLDNANLDALYGKLFANLKEGDNSIYLHGKDFIDVNSKAIKDLEELLKFIIASKTPKEGYTFNEIITKFSSEIKNAFSNKKISSEDADVAYLNIIRYIPENNKDLMNDRLTIMANEFLRNRCFSLADKYYDQLLIENKNNFDVWWNKVLVEAECIDNGELICTNNNFSETKNYLNAYRNASQEQQKILNSTFKQWETLKEKRKFKPLVDKILEKTGAEVERDIIKSEVMLNDLPEFNELLNKGSDEIVEKFKLIESLQKQYQELELEIKSKQKEIDEIELNIRKLKK